MFAIFFVLSTSSVTADPGWWTAQNVLTTNAPSDYSPALQGQAKHLAESAQEEFDYMLEDGASSGVTNLIAGFSSSNNFFTLNLGQLKTLATPFYDQLDSLSLSNAAPAGVTNLYPWTATVTDDSDYAAATLGQLKYVFSFDLDTDDDRLPDWWEQRIIDDDLEDSISSLADVVGGEDYDGDGESNLDEFLNRTDPTVNDVSPPAVTITEPETSIIWVP